VGGAATLALNPGTAAAFGGGSFTVTLEPLGSDAANPQAARSRKSGGTRAGMKPASGPRRLQTAKPTESSPHSGETGAGQIAERVAEGLS
jgi:hypothetical protein